MQEVVKMEIIKWGDVRVIYPIADRTWVCPIKCMPKNGVMTVMLSIRNDLVPMQTVDE